MYLFRRPIKKKDSSPGGQFQLQRNVSDEEAKTGNNNNKSVMGITVPRRIYWTRNVIRI